jgi:hypothetical protein
MRATQPTGTVGLVDPFAGNHWMRNGSASLQFCWGHPRLSDCGEVNVIG